MANAEQQPLLGSASNANSTPPQIESLEDEPTSYELDSLGRRPYAFKAHLGRALESESTHWAVILLTALDGIFVISSISYDFLEDKSCICDHSCGEPPAFLDIFELLSILITSLFLIEIPLSLYALGLKHYTRAEHAALHSFDAAVIVATFILEVALRGREAEVAGLLVLLRLWRLVKLISTTVVGVSEVNDVESRPGRGAEAGPREETLLEAVKEEYTRDKAALLGEIGTLRKRVIELENKLIGRGEGQ